MRADEVVPCAPTPSLPFCDSLLGALTSGLRPCWYDKKLVVSLKACFDESGDPRSQDFFTVAGLMSTLKQWRSFYPRWRATLKSEPTIRYFKMSDAAAREGEFKGWTKRSRDRKVRALASVVQEFSTVNFLVIILTREFRRIMRVSNLRDSFQDPYLLGFAGAVQAVARYMDEQHPKYRNPLLVFDRLSDRRKENRARGIYDHLIDGGTMPGAARLGELVFQHDTEEEIAVQAADLLAWLFRTTPWERHRGRATRSEFRKVAGVPVRGFVFGKPEAMEWRFALRDYPGAEY